MSKYLYLEDGSLEGPDGLGTCSRGDKFL
ncbi:hypothetical protein CEXT_32571, partial [Caerostris extrusa]